MREKHTFERVQHRRSRTEAEQLVDAFESGGLGRREFCLKHGVALGTLDFWRKRRRQERDKVASKRLGMGKDVRAGVASGSRLVAVELAGLQEKAASGGLVVVVSRGRRIEVPRWFDASTLERLLAVLEQV